MDPTPGQLHALKAIICHLLAKHYRDVIAYGAGWTDQDRRQPIGDTGRYEPRRIDAILNAELQRALEDPDPAPPLEPISPLPLGTICGTQLRRDEGDARFPRAAAAAGHSALECDEGRGTMTRPCRASPSRRWGSRSGSGLHLCGAHNERPATGRQKSLPVASPLDEDRVCRVMAAVMVGAVRAAAQRALATRKERARSGSTTLAARPREGEPGCACRSPRIRWAASTPETPAIAAEQGSGATALADRRRGRGPLRKWRIRGHALVVSEDLLRDHRGTPAAGFQTRARGADHARVGPRTPASAPLQGRSTSRGGRRRPSHCLARCALGMPVGLLLDHEGECQPDQHHALSRVDDDPHPRALEPP
jgi:hypothetical protein